MKAKIDSGDRERASETLYAFNVSKQSFLCLGVKIANTPLARLRGLLGKMRLRSDEGLWTLPSRGIHTIGLMFPVDVVYLNAQQQAVHLIESLGPLRIGAIRFDSESVLELPAKTIFLSGTQVGDQLMICTPDEMERYWAAQRVEVPARKPRSG